MCIPHMRYKGGHRHRDKEIDFIKIDPFIMNLVEPVSLKIDGFKSKKMCHGIGRIGFI